MGILITAVPETEMESTGSLRVLVGTARISSVLLRANDIAVNRPSDCCGGPINDICVKFGGGGIHRRLSSSIVVACNAFSEVVGLYLARVGVEAASTPLPVDFIVVVRHQDCTSNDALAWCSLQGDFNAAEEQIEARPDIRCVAALSKCEVRPIGAAILDNSLVCKCPV